ncbi:Eisosome component PIL1-domain-containing protein [Pisolithus marmoratus]|nr:Eisosome component PIL1-domain-containing protein [Pisolithus marmoratus]
MSVSSFFSQIADKAQSAINQTQLAGHHIPGSPSGGAGQPSANQAAGQGGARSHTLETLQHQLRNIGQQYTSTTPLQRIITTEKGVALDLDSLSRDSKAQSKELYTWGQGDDSDLRDVTDRLAYLNFVNGSLASSLAAKLDAARTPLKALRDAESAIAPKRNARANLQSRIRKLEHSQDKTAARQIAELEDQLARAEKNDEPHEKEILILKRKAVRDSERAKWEAIREYGEKLTLLSQAANPIIEALPTLPPTQDNPYTGAQRTAEARAALQRALDQYKPGLTTLPPPDLSRSDTRSFGESHASELSNIPTEEPTHPGLSITPPPAETEHKSPSPIDPHALNRSPAPIPAHSSPRIVPVPGGVHPMGEGSPGTSIPEGVPTVAETGVPLSAGPSGPGPASGSLKDMRSGSHGLDTQSGDQVRKASVDDLYSSPRSQGETAQEEKKRLEREEMERVATSASKPQFESAEDEKKRLEREEQERVRAGGGSSGQNEGEQKDAEELPPYKDIEE